MENVVHKLAQLQGAGWLCRGQRAGYGGLVPSIERGTYKGLSRFEKLALERQSIDIFRSSARFFASEGERCALSSNVGTLMVLRHYGVPTRLLDWSQSPYVAAYFALEGSRTDNGEIWAFDQRHFEKTAEEKQWRECPETTEGNTGKGEDFRADLTAFAVEEPSNWFASHFYGPGFPRQTAQRGAYTMTARFDRDHAEAIEDFFEEPSRHHLYVVSASVKQKVEEYLRKYHGIWRGSLFPDSAGSAKTVHDILFPEPEGERDQAERGRTHESQGFGCETE